MITLPWPDKRLTPNAKRRLHWSKYRGAAANDRKVGYWATFDQLQLGIRDVRAKVAKAEKINIEVTFYPPDRRRRDADGMIGAAKHLFDGMCDALCVDDRRLSPTFHFGDASAPGRVEVRLT